MHMSSNACIWVECLSHLLVKSNASCWRNGRNGDIVSIQIHMFGKTNLPLHLCTYMRKDSLYLACSMTTSQMHATSHDSGFPSQMLADNNAI
jgi:hypothetical protein